MRRLLSGPPPRLGTVAFVCILALSIFGFLTLRSGAKVPVQFDMDGWTTFKKRDIAMLLYAAGGTLGWLIGRAAKLFWLRWLMTAFLLALVITEIAAISSAHEIIRSR